MTEMSPDDWNRIEEQLKKDLPAKRYHHTVGVTYTACALAMRYGCDIDKARLAGLLHDCAKNLPDSEKRALCEKGGRGAEGMIPSLLHAPAGSVRAREVFGVSDTDILSAIEWHTTGRPDMTLLEKIIYVADYIEPDRHSAPGLGEIRRLAFEDLDACVERIMGSICDYLASSEKVTDPMTKSAYEWYKDHNSKSKGE